MSTFHPLYPPTQILTSAPTTPLDATTFLQTFIHWTSSTRPIRNRQHPYNSLPVVPFPHSVLNNLRRIEMGLRGEQAPRLKPPVSKDSKPKYVNQKRKFGDEEEEVVVVVTGEVSAEDAVANALDDEGSRGEEMEVQMGGREMRTDGVVVEGAPTVLTEAGAGGGEIQIVKGKERRKMDKKARRKEEKKIREEKRRKGGDGDGEGEEEED